MADISEALNIERKVGGRKATLKDALSSIVAQYNKLTSKKTHRIDSARRCLIYNLPFGCTFVIIASSSKPLTLELSSNTS